MLVAMTRYHNQGLYAIERSSAAAIDRLAVAARQLPDADSEVVCCHPFVLSSRGAHLRVRNGCAVATGKQGSSLGGVWGRWWVSTCALHNINDAVESRIRFKPLPPLNTAKRVA